MAESKKKKKIAVIATFFWPVSGDVEDYPFNIARMLKEAKQNFEVLTPAAWPDGRRIPKMAGSYKGIKIRRFHVYAGITWFTKLWLPKFENADIIHCCGGYRHPHMFFAFLRRGKAKFMLSPFFPMHPRKNPFLKLAVWIIDRTIGKYVISHSACCFAETKQEVSWLKKLGAKKVAMLPNSLPDEAFKRGDASAFRKKYKLQGKMLFSLGRQVPIKNFEEIISIMPELIKEFPNIRLVIGGEKTQYTEKCKKLTENLGVKKNIFWPGFMNQQEKTDAYSACNIYVCSSIRESLGTTVLEAMAQGKPVLATNAGGIPEVIPDRFCLYKQGNRDELINKIKKLLTNKKLASKIARKGKRKALQFRFENIKKTYLKTINELS